MKLPLVLLSSFAVTGILAGTTDESLPLPFNFARYTPMLNHSPFAVATAVALPEATPDFARDLYIANAARSPEADMVTIKSSSDQNFKKYLTTREPMDGYSIASIEWSEKVGATKVTISKDGKSATIAFNQAFVSQQNPGSASRIPGPEIAGITSPFVQRSIAQQVAHRHARGVTQQDPEATGTANPSPPKPERIPDSELDRLAGAPESVPLPAPNPGAARVTSPRLPPSNINLSGAPK